MHTMRGLQKPARMGMRRFLNSRFQCDDDHSRIGAMDSVVIAGRSAYAVIEWVIKDSNRRQVVGAVLRLERASMPGGTTTIAQEMIESMLQSDTDCPERILRQLCSTDDPRALE